MLWQAHVCANVDGHTFEGEVEAVERGRLSREKFYLVRFSNRDYMHLTATEAVEALVEEEPRAFWRSAEEGGAAVLLPAGIRAAKRRATVLAARGTSSEDMVEDIVLWIGDGKSLNQSTSWNHSSSPSSHWSMRSGPEGSG